jgi:hypothetical protein
MLRIRPNPNQAHQSLTVSSNAQKLAQMGFLIDGGTGVVVIQIVGADVRYTLNGTSAPTAALGFIARADTFLELTTEEAAAAQFIRAGATDAKLEIEGEIW